jgi:hypothetical protein
MQPAPQDITSTPLFMINTAKVDRAIDDYWASEDTQATDDQDFCWGRLPPPLTDGAQTLTLT